MVDLDQFDELDELNELGGLSIFDSFSLRFRAKFAKNHPKVTWFLFALPICSPVIGVVFWGKIGLLAGFFLGIIVLWLGPYIYAKLSGEK